MTTKKYLENLTSNYEEAMGIMKKKNADYANVDDPFYNFKMVENIGVSVEKGITIRMMDKMSRIQNLLQQQEEVEDEKLEDTLLDLMNYANILKTYINLK